MPRFSVHPALAGSGYVVNVQSDMLDELDSRLVIPLIPLRDAHKPMQGINPVLELQGEKLVLYTEHMGAVSRRHLKPAVGSADAYWHQIVAAVDYLMQGF